MISVIIPAYNEECTTEKCIRSLIDQRYSSDYEIIFVDNNSTDKSLSIAKSFKQITVITEKRQGVAWARLAGFEKSRGDIIAYIDADCVADKHWLKTIRESFDDKNTIAVSGRVLYDKQNTDLFYFDWFYWNIYHPFRFKINKPIFWGANMAIRKSSIKKEYFYTKLQAYEDLVLAKYLVKNRNSGEKIIYNKNALITTFDTQSHMPDRSVIDHLLADFGIFRKHMHHR